MFTHELCSKPGCNKFAISRINRMGEIDSKNSFCLEHHPDIEGFKQDLIKYFNTNDKIVGLYAYGLRFDGLDFSGKGFYGCYMHHCTFTNIHTEHFRSRISTFDFSTFSDCNLIKSNLQFVSLAGSKFSHVLFTDSELVQNNFCGIQSYQSSFDDSDLYNSRFIRANLVNTSFRNCNLKRTNFAEISIQNISLKLSNTREAFFTLPPEVIREAEGKSAEDKDKEKEE